MTLPSSGSISLNQMHIEVGGSSGSTVSLNDSDIRGLISKSSGATMSFSEWYGASSFTAETQLVITSASSGIKFANPGFSTYSSGIGPGSLGSASDNQITLYSGSTAYFHRIDGSSFMSNAATFDFNGSSSASAGNMSSTTYLSGIYWRTTFSGNGNPGNHLLGTSQAYNLTSLGMNFVGQRLNKTGWTTGSPVGVSAGTYTIQVF